MALNSSQQRRLNRTNSDYPGTIFSSTNVLLDFVEALDPDDVRHWTPVQQRDAVGFIRHCIHVMCADPMAVIPGHPGGPRIVYMLAQSDLYFFLLVVGGDMYHAGRKASNNIDNKIVIFIKITGFNSSTQHYSPRPARRSLLYTHHHTHITRPLPRAFLHGQLLSRKENMTCTWDISYYY
jgi:hypothetical protein